MLTYVWQGECPKCHNCYEDTSYTSENPHPHGTICPNCHDKGYYTVGVIHFELVQTDYQYEME